MQLMKLQSSLNSVAEQFLKENCAVEVLPKDIGLDTRSAYSLLYISEHFVAKKGSTHSLNYYGGFQYIEDVLITKAGDYTFYSAEDGRVEDCIRYYNDQVEAEMEEGEQEN